MYFLHRWIEWIQCSLCLNSFSKEVSISSFTHSLFFSKTTSSKYKNYFANFFVLFVFSWPFFWCRTPKSTSKQVDRNPANVKKMKNKQSGTVKFWTLEKCLLLTNLTGQMFPQSVGFNSHIYLGKSPWKQYERGSLFTNKKAWFDGWKNPLSHSNQTN